MGDELHFPLVDEPIGEIVERIQAEEPNVAALAGSPRRQLAFRTFAYVRVGILLGRLLVERDVDPDAKATWVEQLLSDPGTLDAVRAEAARERFRAFARGLGY